MLAAYSPVEKAILHEVATRWSIISRPNQRAPAGDWNYWLVMAEDSIGIPVRNASRILSTLSGVYFDSAITPP